MAMAANASAPGSEPFTFVGVWVHHSGVVDTGVQPRIKRYMAITTHLETERAKTPPSEPVALIFPPCACPSLIAQRFCIRQERKVRSCISRYFVRIGERPTNKNKQLLSQRILLRLLDEIRSEVWSWAAESL